MTRALKCLAAVVVVLALATGGTVGVRRWLARGETTPIASAPGDAPMGAPASSTNSDSRGAMTTARGPVTIDLRRQQLIGVRLVPVVRAPLTQTVRAVGVVRYDETRQTDVNLKVDGWIRDLYVDTTGQSVEKGQPLFAVYSPDLVTTEQEYLLALRTRDQLQRSTLADARARAEQLAASARQRLERWDLSADDLRALDERGAVLDAVTVHSPAAGIVLEKTAIQGLHVAPGQTLYKLADVSTVWVEADVYENEIAGLRIGAAATVTIDAYPGERFNGRATYVYPYLDANTRTNKVRFALPNPGGRLKPGMFANVEISLSGGVGLVVPTNAVLDSGTEQVAFVSQGDGVFEPRTVKVGRRLGDTVQILEGLKEGEQVATGAAFFLDSESQLRASLQGFDRAPGAGGVAPGAAAIDIVFRTVPDPPKAGDNELEAVVRDANGKPVDDAEVTVQFLMPAMPTMNMPAMRTEARLSRAASGTYRGTGQVMMAGRWDTTVTVTRAGQRLGTKQLTVVTQ